MAEDPVDDVRRYLERDENKAKEQFTVSLRGKSSEELMAILTSQKKKDDEEKCIGVDSISTKSGDQYGSVSLGMSKGGVMNTPSAAKNMHEDDSINSTVSTEKLVEITRVETSRDGQFSHMIESDKQCSIQEERSAAWQAMRSGVLVTKKELEEVQREMIIQERVLKALEKDNTNLHEERRILRAKLSEMEQKAVSIGAKYSILASGQTPNNRVGQSITSVAPFPTQGKQCCNEGELHIELERQKTLVRELQLELELLRREKKDVETRLASLDFKKIEEMELELRNLRVDLKRKETQHSETVKDMARKIAWYVEHQEFNHSQEELLKEQQDTIRRLRTRLHEMGAMDDGGKHKRTGKDARVQHLTKRVVELEEALNSKHPNSIPQLIRGCQPSVQDSKQFKRLNHRIKELEEALAEKDRCAEAAVNRLRVETDRMKLQYQERIDKLEEELKLRLLHAQTRRVRELEKQLTEARQALRERDQERAAPLSAVVNLDSVGGCVQEKSDMPSTAVEDIKPLPEVRQTEMNNDVKEAISLLRKENEILRSQLSQVVNDITRNTLETLSPQSAGVSTFSSQLPSSMQAHISSIAAELAVYKRLLMESQESLRDAHARWEERLQTLRQSYQSQIQQIRQEHNDDIKRIQEHHQREMRSVAEEVQAAEETSKVCQKLVHRIPEDPRHSRAFLQSVAERLAYLERRHVQKERETAHEIAEVRRVASFELTLAKQKAEIMIEYKNQQIHEFRLQLDQLLGSMALLQTHA